MRGLLTPRPERPGRMRGGHARTCVPSRRAATRSELRGGRLVVGELVEEVVREVRTAIAEVDVVRVLPHVELQQHLALARGERRAGIRRLGDLQLAVVGEDQPRPARAELAESRRLELFLALVDAAEIGVDSGFELARDAPAVRRQRLPE